MNYLLIGIFICYTLGLFDCRFSFQRSNRAWCALFEEYIQCLSALRHCIDTQFITPLVTSNHLQIPFRCATKPNQSFSKETNILQNFKVKLSSGT